MMQEQVQKRVSEAFPDAQVQVQVEGNRATIEVVSERFNQMNRVQRQQAGYGCIEDFIADGSLHAVTIRASVPA